MDLRSRENVECQKGSNGAPHRGARRGVMGVVSSTSSFLVFRGPTSAGGFCVVLRVPSELVGRIRALCVLCALLNLAASIYRVRKGV
jgi:hypothetical protein